MTPLYLRNRYSYRCLRQGVERNEKCSFHNFLLKRGDTFSADEEEAFLDGLGGLPSNKHGRYVLALEVSGESAEARFILSTYGDGGPSDYTGPRPVLNLLWPFAENTDIGKQQVLNGIGNFVSSYKTGEATGGTWCDSGVLEDCLDQVETGT